MTLNHHSWRRAARGTGRRPLPAGSLLVVLVLATGCGSRATSAGAVHAQPVPAPASPLGTALIATGGTGPTTISVPGLTSGSQLSVRFACTGTGTVLLSDQSAAEVLSIKGCAPHARYDTGFTSTADDATMHIGVDPGVVWNIGVWQR